MRSLLQGQYKEDKLGPCARLTCTNRGVVPPCLLLLGPGTLTSLGPHCPCGHPGCPGLGPSSKKRCLLTTSPPSSCVSQPACTTSFWSSGGPGRSRARWVPPVRWPGRHPPASPLLSPPAACTRRHGGPRPCPAPWSSLGGWGGPLGLVGRAPETRTCAEGVDGVGRKVARRRVSRFVRQDSPNQRPCAQQAGTGQALPGVLADALAF